MKFDQHPAGLDDVFCFAVVEADGLDVFGQALTPPGHKSRRSIGHRDTVCAVALLTPTSVAWAERITEISSSKGEQ